MLSLALALTASSWAGWTQTDAENGCTFYLGDRQGEYAPVRAVCDWDLPPDTLHRLLAALADHDLYFSSVARAEAVDAAAGLYRQVHQASGISDREIIIEMGASPVEGGTRYWWKKHTDQSALTGDNVEAVADTGYWEISAGANGGSRVVYELYYDPGGSVPSFLVRWFQGAGTRDLVGELKSYASR